jgi:hypothetical protein
LLKSVIWVKGVAMLTLLSTCSRKTSSVATVVLAVC